MSIEINNPLENAILKPKIVNWDPLLDRGDLQGGTLRSNTPRKGVSRKMTPKRGINVSPKVKASTPEFQKILRRIKEKRRTRDLKAGYLGGLSQRNMKLPKNESSGINKNVKKLKNIFENKEERMNIVKRPQEFKSKPHTPKRGGSRKEEEEFHEHMRRKSAQNL